MRDEKLEREYPEVRSDFYLDVYDKSVLSIVDLTNYTWEEYFKVGNKKKLQIKYKSECKITE